MVWFPWHFRILYMVAAAIEKVSGNAYASIIWMGDLRRLGIYRGRI